MGVPFGFSVGDIIAGIGVIKTSINAFSDTRGARKDHKQLSNTLIRLSESLELIRGIKVDPIHDAQQQVSAVQECKSCVDDFVCSIAKYRIIQPGLQPPVWKSQVRTAAKKVQWAFFKKEDIAKFRSELGLQYDNISILLATLQIHHQRREAALQEADRNQNVVHREVLLETRAFSQQTHALVGRQLTALDSLVNGQIETQTLVKYLQREMSDEKLLMLNQLLSMMESQTRTTQSIFDKMAIFTAQSGLQTQIPPQVLLQKPVIFRDALDRVTPIHLDFIDSAEAFVAVLKVRFKDVGLKKLERDEYLLEDGKDNRSLDVRKPWSRVMQPGQHVTMSMIFKKSFQQNTCPGCLLANTGYHGQETTCVNCGRTYRLVEDDRVVGSPVSSRVNLDTRPKLKGEEVRELISDAEDGLDGEVSDFRRVHLIGTSISQARELQEQEDVIAQREKEEAGIFYKKVTEIAEMAEAAHRKAKALQIADEDIRKAEREAEEAHRLEMEMTKSIQEERAMRSMTSSVLEDVGQGNSPLTAGSG